MIFFHKKYKKNGQDQNEIYSDIMLIEAFLFIFNKRNPFVKFFNAVLYFGNHHAK